MIITLHYFIIIIIIIINALLLNTIFSVRYIMMDKQIDTFIQLHSKYIWILNVVITID